MIRAVYVALVVLVTTAFVASVAPPAFAQPAVAVPPAPADRQASCSWLDEFVQTLGELGEENGLWTIDPRQPSWRGQPMLAVTTDAGVVVWEGIPCEYVPDALRHEHMHLQQVREFGSMEIAAERLAIDGRDRLEITADCASMLAGSTYTPYVAQAGGCSPRDLDDARQLLTWPTS